MAAIQEARQGRSFGHAPHQFGIDRVVMNLTSHLVVNRDQCLVIYILFIVVFIYKTTSMTGIVKEGTISTFRRGNQLPKGGNDIFVSW